MKKRLFPACVLALVAALAALTAATTASGAAAGSLTVVGPWTGASEQSFRAVLDNFQQRNPGVTVTYTGAADVPAAVRGTASTADVAVLSLPTDLDEMRAMAADGTIAPIEFAVPAVKANYAFTWKTLGSVDGKLYGVFLKATNRSAFWYDLRRFQNNGLQPPTSWAGLQKLSDTLLARGLKPFAVSGSSGITLPNLFANVYLMLRGNRSYDALSRGAIRWTDPSVRDVLRAMRGVLANPDRIAGGLESLRTDYRSAVQNVFGSPQRAGMVAGGSAVLPVLYTAKAARPIQQFGAFPFPTADGKAPSRVIGEGDAAVMVKDSPEARALVSFLATPAAATIWAKRGGDYLSPNRAVDLDAYATPAMRTLATALTRASVFRFGIAEAKPAAFTSVLNRMLIDYIRHPAQVSRITAQIDAAAPKA